MRVGSSETFYATHPWIQLLPGWVHLTRRRLDCFHGAHSQKLNVCIKTLRVLIT